MGNDITVFAIGLILGLAPTQLSLNPPSDRCLAPSSMQQDNELRVEVDADPTTSLRRSFKLRCRISNRGGTPLYVYSALFAEPTFVQAVVDSKQRLIEFRFTRLRAEAIAPYYFPKAEFWRIEPGASRSFIFSTRTAPANIRASGVVDSGQEEQRITAGRWTIRVLIGYGNEIASMASSSKTKGWVHPINSIVAWQRTVLSNITTVVLTT